MLRIALLFLCSMLSACNTLHTPSSASSDSSSSSGSDQGSDGESAGVVCRKESVPGSHVRRRVCRTKEESKQGREAAEQRMRANSAPGALPAGEMQR